MCHNIDDIENYQWNHNIDNIDKYQLCLGLGSQVRYSKQITFLWPVIFQAMITIQLVSTYFDT